MKNTRFLMHVLSFLLTIISYYSLDARSVFRPRDPSLPRIDICWADTKTSCYSLVDPHLEYHPIFDFDRQFFDEHLLPTDYITHPHDPYQHVSCAELSALINNLISEIYQGKKKFRHFQVIKKRNFNFKKRSGLLIIGFFDNYPFVIKLFIETPQTFFDYYAKGIEPTCFFYMSGGANRHITGLTRIKNREHILQKAQRMPAWRNRIIMPRKWFWLPKNARWLSLTGYNLCHDKKVTTEIPAIYAVIADRIDVTPDTTLSRQEQTNIIFKFCHDFDLFIDAHRDNFVFKQDKLVIVDTEHFPSIVGIKRKKTFSSYGPWVIFLIQKCIHDCYFRAKSECRPAVSLYHELLL